MSQNIQSGSGWMLLIVFQMLISLVWRWMSLIKILVMCLVAIYISGNMWPLGCGVCLPRCIVIDKNHEARIPGFHIAIFRSHIRIIQLGMNRCYGWQGEGPMSWNILSIFNHIVALMVTLYERTELPRNNFRLNLTSDPPCRLHISSITGNKELQY